MVEVENRYSAMQKRQMNAESSNMARGNHQEHNKNHDYWNVLLADIQEDPDAWEDKKALDFGCGCGRNVENLLKLAEWERVDGVDISEANIEVCKKFVRDLGSHFDGRSRFFANNGVDLSGLASDEYDFVMSTIVFQHICVHEIRKSLKTEIFRILKEGGVFSFQMNFGPVRNNAVAYLDNFYDAQGTNSRCDTRVDDPQELIDDLEEIGFKNITYEIKPSFSCNGVDKWIYVRCEK